VRIMTKEEITKAVDNLKKIRKQFNKYEFTHSIDLAIDALEERERPTGEWIFDGFCFSSSKFKCSICHYPELEKTNYCPTCGAKMEGGQQK